MSWCRGSLPGTSSQFCSSRWHWLSSGASFLSQFLESVGFFFWNVYFCTFRKIHNLYLYLFFQYFFHNLAGCAGVFNWLLVTHQSLCSFFLCCLQWSFTRLTNAVQKENTSGLELVISSSFAFVFVLSVCSLTILSSIFFHNLFFWSRLMGNSFFSPGTQAAVSFFNYFAVIICSNFTPSDH